MPDIEVVVEISEDNPPNMLPVVPVVVNPGETEIRWILTTANLVNAMQATFGLPGVAAPGIEFGTLLEDITLVSSGPGANDKEWVVKISNGRTPAPRTADVSYTIHFTFDGLGHSHDPVIVVTGEPIPTP